MSKVKNICYEYFILILEFPFYLLEEFKHFCVPYCINIIKNITNHKVRDYHHVTTIHSVKSTTGYLLFSFQNGQESFFSTMSIMSTYMCVYSIFIVQNFLLALLVIFHVMFVIVKLVFMNFCCY